jgi:hypothetical protein
VQGEKDRIQHRKHQLDAENAAKRRTLEDEKRAQKQSLKDEEQR